MTSSGPRSGDERDLSGEAIRQEESIRDTVESLLDTDAFQRAGEKAPDDAEPHAPEDTLSPAARGMAVGSVISDILIEDAAERGPLGDRSEYRARSRWATVLRLLLALVAIGGAMLIAAMLVINSRDEGSPASPDAAAPAAGAAAGSDCTVPPGTVTVVTTVTDTTTDNHRTNVRGETIITNTGAVPVYVVYRESHSNGHDNAGTALLDEGWYGGPFIIQPGESRTELVGAQVFTSGESTWGVITDLAVFPTSPECTQPVFANRDQSFADLAEPVANPFPVGPGS